MEITEMTDEKMSKYLELNSKLQQKKNSLRKALKEKGVLAKGDKAGYEAYTGALKYYLANTFMIATGDDPEKESPSNRMNTVTSERKASDMQIAMLKQRYTGEDLTKLLVANNVSRIEDLPMKTASAIISKLIEGLKRYI